MNFPTYWQHSLNENKPPTLPINRLDMPELECLSTRSVRGAVRTLAKGGELYLEDARHFYVAAEGRRARSTSPTRSACVESSCWPWRGDVRISDGYLEGKTARIIATMDTPKILYRLLYSAPSINQLKKTTLEFCGVKPVKVTQFAPVKGSTQETRERWVKTVHELGTKGA